MTTLYSLRHFISVNYGCQRAVTTVCYKPDGSLFVLVGANKVGGGANNGTLQ